MISRKELHERTSLRKIEIEKEIMDKKRKEEKRIAELVEVSVEKCYSEMTTSADKGHFYVEVDMPCEIINLVMVKMSEFSPGIVSYDGLRKRLSLRWK